MTYHEHDTNSFFLVVDAWLLLLMLGDDDAQMFTCARTSGNITVGAVR